MKEKLEVLAQKIAQLAQVGHAKQPPTDGHSASSDKPQVSQPSSQSSWHSSFLGAERSTQPPEAGPWERAKQVCLDRSQASLRQLPLSIQIAATIGREIWAARQIAPGKAMQIVSGPKLVAVLSTASPVVSVRADIVPEDLACMTALVRPDSASGTPVGFKNFDLWDLLWQYGAHDGSALQELPAEVAWRPLQLRRLPQVSPYLLHPRHATIMRHLLAADQSYAQLLQLTHANAEVLCQDIAALMLTRSVRAV